MQHHGRKVLFRAQAVARGIVSGIDLAVLIHKGQFLLDVVLGRLDPVDIRRRNHPQVGHPRPVGGDQQEEVARAGQLVAKLHHSDGHPVERVPPESPQEVLREGMVAFQVHPAAHHIFAGQFHQPPGQGIAAPGRQAGLQHRFSVRVQPVPGRFVQTPRAHQKAVVVFDYGQPFPHGSLHQGLEPASQPAFCQ